MLIFPFSAKSRIVFDSAKFFEKATRACYIQIALESMLLPILIVTESRPKVMFSTTNKDSHLLSTNNNSRFDFFFSSLFSLEFELPYTFLHHKLALLPCECSLSEVCETPLSEDIVEIVVKYNKNIRRVEWMTSHPLQNVFSLNWVRLMAAVKLANKNRKKVRKMKEFCLEFWLEYQEYARQPKTACRMHQMPIWIKLAPFLCYLSRAASTQSLNEKHCSYTA